MKYLIIDGYLSGTGVREKHESGFIPIKTLNISDALKQRIYQWQKLYETEHYNNFKNHQIVKELDQEGLRIKTELNAIEEYKVEYFSSWLNKYLL